MDDSQVEEINNMFDDKTILVTGGTGSFGNTFIPMTIKKYKPKRIIVYSRDEMKQWEMAKKFENESSIRFLSVMLEIKIVYTGLLTESIM